MKSVSGDYLRNRNGVLHLQNVKITPVDSAALFEFFGSSKELKRLRLGENCDIRGEYSYRKMEKLFSTKGNAITAFECVVNRRDSEYLKYIFYALKSEYCRLTELCCEGEALYECVHFITEALQQNCKLTVLNLCNRFMTDYGVECLSVGALRSENCALAALNLDDNFITDQGVEYISEALTSENYKLTKLNLRKIYMPDHTVAVGYLSVAYIVEHVIDDKILTNRL